MKYSLALAIAGLSFLIFSCNSNPEGHKLTELDKDVEAAPVTKELPDSEKQFGFSADSIAGPQENGDKQERKKQQPPANTATKTDWDKKIVKTASINLEVKDYNSFYTSLREKVKNLGGYVAQEEQSQSDYKVENTMVIKVPVDEFDNAVVQISSAAVKVNERKITSQDVTTEIVDTRSRLEAKKQVRQRYLDLLNQSRNMNDILSVQSEINGIQEEIESAAGRIGYLSHASAFSTINLTYFQVLNSAAKTAEAEKNPSFGDKLKDAFRVGWEIVSNLVLVIVTIWPLLLASFFAFILFKRIKGSRANKGEDKAVGR